MEIKLIKKVGHRLFRDLMPLPLAIITIMLYGQAKIAIITECYAAKNLSLNNYKLVLYFRLTMNKNF
jgi:hypothetical protein